jgi:hypothetical protein
VRARAQWRFRIAVGSTAYGHAHQTLWRCPVPQVVPLPRKPCVRQVLSDFIVWKAETCQDMLEVEKEILRDLTGKNSGKILSVVTLYIIHTTALTF